MNRIVITTMMILGMLISLSAQDEKAYNKNNREIGLSINNMTEEGLTLELFYVRPLFSGIYGSAKIGYNFNDTKSVRFGLRYDVIQRGRFRLRMGLDYARVDKDGETFNSVDRIYTNLEIPLDLSYRFNDKWNVNLTASGVIKRFKKESDNFNYNNNGFWNSLRVGVGKRF